MQDRTIEIELINDQAKVHFDKKEFDKALVLLNRPDLPKELLVNLAKCYYYTKQADKALEIMLSLEKNQEAWIDTALYYNALGYSDKSYQIYQQLDQNDYKVKFNIGYHYLERDEFLKGFEHTQYGAYVRAWGSEYVLLEQNLVKKEQRWNGEFTNHLALMLEGGLGDGFIFLRWAKYLESKCNQLTVFCNPQLLRLLVNSGFNAQPEGMINQIKFDHYVSAMSLPVVCKLNHPQENVEFPIIESFVEPFITKQINNIAGNKKKIGIKWFGNPEFEHDQFRTVPSEALKGLSKFGQLFSLQFEDADPRIPNCNFLVKDWQDTYSVLKSLDLLVTSCTSVAHLAGSIGVKVVVLVPLVPYFTWASNNTKWYPDNVIVIRQTKYNDWTEAINKLYDYMSTL